MKRVPLNRKTPLRRLSAKREAELKGKRIYSTLNKISSKKRKELRETDAIRHAYLAAELPCECCFRRPADDPHEIPSGSGRHRAVYQPNAILFLCRECHFNLQGKPPAEQIAVKVRAMVRVHNECRGCNAVSTNKVIVALGGIPRQGNFGE